MDQDKQMHKAFLLEDTILEDFQNVITSMTDAQTALNYFENDPENPKILVFLNILIQQLNNSIKVYKTMDTSDEKQKFKLIIRHVKELCKLIDEKIKYNTIISEYLQFYVNKIISLQNVEEKKLFNVSQKEEEEVLNFLKGIPTQQWYQDQFISKDEILGDLMKRKGKLFLDMQMLWINTIQSEPIKDYGKPLYLRASYQSDLIFFGVAVVLCIIVAYFMSY